MFLKMLENTVCAQPQKWEGLGTEEYSRKVKRADHGKPHIYIYILYIFIYIYIYTYIKILKTTKNWIASQVSQG